MIISQTSRKPIWDALNQLLEQGATRPTTETREVAEAHQQNLDKLDAELRSSGSGSGIVDAARRRGLSKMAEARLIKDLLAEIGKDLSSSPNEKTPGNGKQALELLDRLRDMNEIGAFTAPGLPPKVAAQLGLSKEEEARLDSLLVGAEAEHADLVGRLERAEDHALRALLVHIGALCRDATVEITTGAGPSVSAERIAQLRQEVESLMPGLTSGASRVGLGFTLAEALRFDPRHDGPAAIYRSVQSLLDSLELLARTDDQLLLRLERGEDPKAMKAELEAAVASGKLSPAQVDEASLRGRDFLAERQASDLRFGFQSVDELDPALAQHGLDRGLYTAEQWQSLLDWAKKLRPRPGPDARHPLNAPFSPREWGDGDIHATVRLPDGRPHPAERPRSAPERADGSISRPARATNGGRGAERPADLDGHGRVRGPGELGRP